MIVYANENIDFEKIIDNAHEHVYIYLDGFWPDPMVEDDEDVTILHSSNIVGEELAMEDIKRIIPESYDDGQIDVSVIMPARNEIYLQRTIEELLEKLETRFEIMVGLDGYTPDPPIKEHPRVRVIQSEKIGMRPMINKLIGLARGRFVMRLDPHCCVDQGIDRKLIESWKKDYTIVARRYELDSKRWKRRERTDCDYRYLTPLSDENGGLRSLAWPEYAKTHEHESVGEVMTVSGSNWLMERSRFLGWGGMDENHGVFGQEGAEIACMTWLSGGKFLVNKNTWYAHWNRGKAPYALGRNQKKKSIDYSIEKWTGDKWKYQKYSFQWLIDKFNPPGWELRTYDDGLKHPRQGAKVKGKTYPISTLWDKRAEIAEPLKRHRLMIFYEVFEEFLDLIDSGKQFEIKDTRYYEYLCTHLHPNYRDPVTKTGSRHAVKKAENAIALYKSIQVNGMRSPLEMYGDNGNLILLKGYRRLVIIHHLGYQSTPVCFYKTKVDAKNLSAFDETTPNELRDIVQEQFIKYGDRSTDKYWVHNYVKYYDRYFSPIRGKVKKVLEIGVFRGASLAMWKEYFPKAEIYGVDKNLTTWKEFADTQDRITMLVGNENDNEFIAREIIGNGPYDIIIDDASHDPEIQHKMYLKLWPSLRKHGYYVIEDCHYSYGKSKNFNYAMIGLPTTLANRTEEIYTGGDVQSLAMYYNICFLKKGVPYKTPEVYEMADTKKKKVIVEKEAPKTEEVPAPVAPPEGGLKKYIKLKKNGIVVKTLLACTHCNGRGKLGKRGDPNRIKCPMCKGKKGFEIPNKK